MNSTPFDPGLIQILVVLAETLSFSKTASRLGVTKGTISRKVRFLEEQAGTELVRRNTHHVALTLAGREAYERARTPLRELAAVFRDLPGEGAPLTGDIRLTVPSNLGIIALPKMLERFLALNPGVRVIVRLTNEPLDLVARNIDLALRIAPGKLPDSSLIARHVADIERGFYAAPSYLERRGRPRALHDPAHDWLSFGPADRGEQKGSRAARNRAVTARSHLPRIEVDDAFLVCELARRGLGIASIPTFVAETHEQDGSLERVLLRARTTLVIGRVYLLAPSRRKAPRHVQAFREHLIQSFGEKALQSGRAEAAKLT
jgi:DNA-binding transcriptional LysR family regulator